MLLSKVSFAQFEGYENVTSNKELIERLELNKEKIENFLYLMQINREVEPKEVKEVKAQRFEFDQNKFDRLVEEKSHYNFKLSNVFKDSKIQIRIDQDPNIFNSSRDWNTTMIPTKIYYFDGYTEIPTKKITLDTYTSNNLNLKKAVQQIDVELVFRTEKQLDSIVVPLKKNQTTKSKDFYFEVIKQDSLSVTIKNNARGLKFDEVHAFTLDNKRIKSQGQSRLSVEPELFEQILNNLLNNINQVLDKSKQNSLLNFEEFKAILLPRLESIQKETSSFYEEDSTINYLTLIFGAPVKQLVLYYLHNPSEQKTQKTLSLKTNQQFLLENTNDSTIVYNLDGNRIASFAGIYTSKNDRFYTNDEDKYFYFDLNQKTMNPLSYYQIRYLTDSYILAKEHKESPYNLIDSDNNKLMKVDKYDIDKDFGLSMIQSNNKYYIINNDNPFPIEIKNIDELSYANKGFFIGKKDNKYGFLNTNGEIVVPLEYDAVKSFQSMVDLTYQDKLFAVKREEKWGFVDTNKKTIIPFMYSNIDEPFSYGIALVSINDQLVIINLKNEKLSVLNKDEYSISINYGKRFIGTSVGQYNNYGELKRK